MPPVGKPFQKGHDPRRVNPRPAGSTFTWEHKRPKPPRPKYKITDEVTFRTMYLKPEIPLKAIAKHFGASWNTVLDTAKRFGLPPRMPMLKAAKLGPFAKRKAA